MEYMATLPDKAFDLAIVDPPYGIGNFKNSTGSRRPYNKEWKIGWNDAPPGTEYFEELYRVSQNVIVWGCNYYGKFVREVGRIVWDKLNSSEIGSDCEIASQPKDRRVVKITIRHTGFCSSDKSKKIHPCQKPVALYEWLLTNYAKPGYRILDTHLGSGSSAIAAHYFGVDFVGCEIDKDYYEAACKRVKEQTRQLRLC
jgi:site-specific DNA-methyltransferase (adenine-specific)